MSDRKWCANQSVMPFGYRILSQHRTWFGAKVAAIRRYPQVVFVNLTSEVREMNAEIDAMPMEQLLAQHEYLLKRNGEQP